MPIDTEQWRAHTGLFCASRVLLQPPRCKQPQPKVQADTLSLNMRFSMAVLLETLRTGIFYASRALQLLCLIACHASWLLSSIVRLSCRRLRGVSVLLALCLVVVQMLLIMSGDVEENPGPPKIQTTILGKDHLVDILEELWDVSSKWYNIGLKLKLSVGTLESLKADPSTALREMLLLWLKKVDPLPTWEGLACALESRTVGEPRLAEQLRTKYCKTEEAAEGAAGKVPPAHTPSPAGLEPYIRHLKLVYKSKTMPTYSKWCPLELSHSNKYIPLKLAVVRKERKIADITRRTEEAEDFIKDGKLKDGSLAKLILVEGDPGIGKTTFAWEICRKWANGDIFQEYELVVLLRLREKWVRKVRTIFDLFHHPNPELSRAVGKEILHHEGESVLLLYEGYDELPRKLQKRSIFLDILQKNYLPRATILITSQPSATRYLRSEFKQISQHLEILGFTNGGIDAYINDTIKDEQVRNNFHRYLKCYPHIREMMYLPLNTVIVTEVYMRRQQSPEKLIPTELYTALTQGILLRYLYSHTEYRQQERNLQSFTDLPRDVYKQFCDITAVALKGIDEDTYEFDTLPNDFNTLGLMQSVPKLYVEQGVLVLYKFFHLTLQEYLAAVNISQQRVEKQIEFFQKSDTGISTRLRNVLKFVAGLTKFKDIPSVSLQPLILKSLPRDHKRKDMTLTSLHWLFEAQCSDTYIKLVNAYPLSTEHRSDMLLFDYFVLGYAMAHITSHWEINLSSRKINDEDIEMLMAGVTFKRDDFTQSEETALQQLDVSNNSIGDRGATVLAEMLKKNSTLQQLDVSRNSIHSGGATALAEMLKENRTLQQLDVSGNSIGDEGATTLAIMLKKNSTLQQLDVGSNSIGDRGATELAKMLKVNRMLQKLDVSFNSIHDGGATALAETLTRGNRMLQQLDICCNCIGERGGMALAEMLKENRTLQQLDVSTNSIGSAGATALAEILKKENRMLQQLNISFNSIGDGGATELAKMLKENGTLQKLDVSFNSIGDGGATALAEKLKENSRLQQLDVSGNSIGDVGATELAKMLKKNTTLQQLDVSNNCLGSGGATTLSVPEREWNCTVLK